MATRTVSEIACMGMAIATLGALAHDANATVLANYDFNSSWTGSKETDFPTFAALAPSIDTDTNTTASLLSNSGHGAGGFGSFPLQNALFATSASGDTGLNVGSANQTEATNYISFTITPGAGISVTYESLTLWTDTAISEDDYNVDVYAVVGTGSETLLGAHAYDTPATVNEPVHFVEYDFADFATTDVVEFRIYGYNTAAENNGVRYDDIIVNGTVVPEPSSLALIGGASLFLLCRKRKG